MKKKIASALLAAGMLFVLTACRAEKTRTLHINSTSSIVSAVDHIMQEKGFLEAHLPENISVEWSEIATGPDIRDAIVSGNLDIADLALSTYISAYENNLPVTLLSHCGLTNIRVYSSNPAIQELSDIQPDSRIAITNKGTNLHTAFLAYCKEILESGMIYDGNLVSIPAADALASLSTSDEFDAAIFSFPNCLKAEQQVEDLILLADMGEIIKEYNIGSVYVANSEFYEKNPDIVEAFLAAQQDAITFIKEFPEETAGILAERYGVDSEDIQNALENLPPHMEILGYDRHAQLLYEAGILTEQPDLFEELPNYDKLPK